MKVGLVVCMLCCLGTTAWAGLFGPSTSDVKDALLSRWKIGHSSKNQRIYRIEADSVKVRKLTKNTWSVEYVTNLEGEGRIRWTAKVRGGSVNGDFGGMAQEETGVKIDAAGRVVDGTVISWDSCPAVPAGIAKTASEFEAAWKSICGYSFAEDYTYGKVDEDGDPLVEVNRRLNPSYRHMTRIVLKHGDFDMCIRNASGGYSNCNLGYGMYEARLVGLLPRSWNKDQLESECKVVAQELGARFGVVLLKIADGHYLYQSSTARKALIVMLSPTLSEVGRVGAEREIVVIIENRDARPKPKARPVEYFRRGGSEVL